MPCISAAIPAKADLLCLGDDAVNFYLLEQDGRYTLFDAALAGSFDQLVAVLADRGADVTAIDAVVLTHAHPDHTGIAERVRVESLARVLVHQDDAHYATSGEPIPSERQPTEYLDMWPQAQRTFEHAMARGAGETPAIGAVETYTDGDVLNVPGRPLVIATPGHTPGHSSLHLRDHRAVIVGDALAGFGVLTGRYGPQIGADGTNTSSEQALASLSRLENLDATLLFGHGDPWIWGAASAVACARALGRS